MNAQWGTNPNIKLVIEGENNFKSNPPNAAISIFGAKNDVTEVIVTLNERPVVKGDDMLFPVKVIEGELPTEGGAVVMFIDPIGRPLSPTSAAGVHRRHRRILGTQMRVPNIDLSFGFKAILKSLAGASSRSSMKIIGSGLINGTSHQNVHSRCCFFFLDSPKQGTPRSRRF